MLCPTAVICVISELEGSYLCLSNPADWLPSKGSGLSIRGFRILLEARRLVHIVSVLQRRAHAGLFVCILSNCSDIRCPSLDKVFESEAILLPASPDAGCL